MQNKIELTLAVLLYPFRSMTFYKEDPFMKIVCNDIKVNRQKALNDLTKNMFWELGRDHPPHSIDEMKLLIQKYYPFIIEEKGMKNTEVFNRYLNVINQLSKSLISHRDGKITYKYWKNQNDQNTFGPYEELQKIQIFSCISRMMPLDIIVANYLLNNEMKEPEQLEGFYSLITLSDMQLEDILVKGVAENHIHVGSSFNFSISWQIMMNQFLTRDKTYINSLDRYIRRDKGIGGNYILACGVIRLILAIYLIEVDKGLDKKHKFYDWLYKFNYDKKHEAKQEVKEKRRDKQKEEHQKEFTVFEKVIDFINLFVSGTDIEDWVNQHKTDKSEGIYFEAFEELWRELITKFNIKIEEHSDDFIFDIFSDSKCIKTYGENLFIFNCLKYIRDNEKDTMFFELFLDYFRIKTNVFNTIVQGGNTIKGLDYFKEFYANARDSIKMVNTKQFWKIFLRTMFQDDFLKKLEVRISLPSQPRKNFSEILSAYKEVIDEDYFAMGKREFPMFGIVIHLLKREDQKPLEKCWRMHDINREITTGELYFGELQQKYKLEMERMIKIRNEIPYLSEFILGLDAASGENDTPVSVFAPIYEKARDSSSQQLLSKNKKGQMIKNKSLSFTFHAGEDFRHLLSGLRRIDEVIEHCKFHAGDRIGHGIALGINVDRWKQVNPVTIIPRGEYLDNLLWVWGIYAHEKNYDPKINIYLENQIYEYASEIYENMNGINTAMLFKAYQERFKMFKVQDKYKNKYKQEDTSNLNEAIIPEIFCINAEDKHTKIWNPEKLNYAYHCKCYLKKIYEPIQVAVTEIDCEITLQIQKIIYDRVARSGIVVEVNPTSNTVIGEMDSLFNHHAYLINNMMDSNNNKIILNINSDNPTVFNTNVSNEIAYLYYGLLYKNVSREDALIWIDKLRDYGIKTSFINNQINHQQYYRYLKEVLEHLGAENNI